MKQYSITLALIMLFYIGTLAQASKEDQKEQKKQERYQKIIELVESGQYEFNGQKANPQSGRQIDLTTRANFLRVDGTNAAAEMPYFGRAYNGVAYTGGDGGINFDGPMEDYAVQLNDKKRRITVTFSVRSNNDNFRCRLTITSPDNATLLVTSNNRQSISYSGSISAPDGDK
jgi:hypothetical protein